MRRSKCSTAFVMLKSFANTSFHCLATLCLIIIVLGCSNNESETTSSDTTGSGTMGENNEILVVSPINSSDDSLDPNTQNNNTNNSSSNDTNANGASSLQDDGGAVQQPQSTNDNTNQPLDDDISTNESVSANVLGGLPTDCIFDISASNVTFCYQTKSRMLRAWQSDGLQWWAYVLPGDNSTNEVHALRIVNGNLYIVAELKSNGIQTGFEISMFAFGGAFVKTVALNKFQDYSFVAGHRIQVADIEDNLIISGDYGLSSNNILPNQFNGTFIAVYNTTNERVEKSRLYPQLQLTNPMQVSGDIIKLELEHLVYEVSPSNLELLEPVDRFQSIPFNRSNYHQKKQGIVGLIEKPPFQALQAQMNTAFSDALQEIHQVDASALINEPINCAGGGTVQQIIVVDELDSEVRTMTFDNCSTTEFTVHGVLLQRQSNNCGQDCEGLNKTLRALAFEVTYANGGHWSVDGYVSTKETRNFVSENNTPIDSPETVYSNLTEINVFSMSDNQISVNLEQGQYQYNGTLKNGTTTWAGSGTVSYATGVTETYTVDLSRQLFNGIQTDFSGQMDANRSDGTALFVDMDTADQSGVRYTTTVDGESVQTTSGW